MEQFQERVVEEQVGLNEKLVKLIEFTKTDTYRALPEDERERLVQQQFVMVDYNKILSERIARF